MKIANLNTHFSLASNGNRRWWLRFLLAAVMFSPVCAFAQATQCGTWGQQIKFTPNNMTYVGTRDGVQVGKPIQSPAGSWDANITGLQLFGGSGCLLNQVAALLAGIEAVPNVTYSEGGVNYQVFKTSVPGVGYVMGMSDGNGVYKDIKNPLGGYLWTYSPARSYLNLDLRFKYIAYASLPTGTYVLQPQNIVQILASNGSNSTGLKFLGTNSATITITARGCTVTNGYNQAAPLNKVPISAFTGPGFSPETGSSVSFSIDCDPDVRVYATVTDANAPTSTSDMLKIETGAGMATGVGVRLFRNGDLTGTPVRFGPESATIGNPNQWWVGNSPSGTARTIFHPGFTAYYYQTATQVTPGQVKATALITFSYQ